MKPSAREPIYKSESRRRIVKSVIFTAAVLAIFSICYAYLNQGAGGWIHTAIIVLWTLGPPLWFLIEHSILFDNWENGEAVEHFRHAQGLATKFWIGIAGLLTAIYASAIWLPK